MDSRISKEKEKTATTMDGNPSEDSTIEFQDYGDEAQLDAVMQLVTQDLSEPYSSAYYA